MTKEYQLHITEKYLIQGNLKNFEIKNPTFCRTFYRSY